MGIKNVLEVGVWPVGLQCQPQSQSLPSGLWILDLGLGFWTWILDRNFGLEFGTGLGLDNYLFEEYHSGNHLDAVILLFEIRNLINVFDKQFNNPFCSNHIKQT